MKQHGRIETVMAILGSAAALMLLVGCGGEEIQKRSGQEAAGITSQLQQNIEEDSSDGLSPDQSEKPEETERSEEVEQSEETGRFLNEEAGDQAQDELDAERIIEEQSFQVELNDWGEVRFVSYEPTLSERDMQEDVVIGAEYMTGIGPQGAIPHTEVRIYEDCGEYFIYNEDLSNEINDYLPWESNVLARDIKRLLQLADGKEPLTNYESYTGKWTVRPGYVAAYENPMPESGNELECTEDGWGGSGTLHIMFLPNQINVEVLNHQIAEENTIGYGVSGSYEMTIRE